MPTCRRLAYDTAIFSFLIWITNHGSAHEIIRNIDPASADAMISLDYEGRFLRRKRLQTDDGEDFMVELPKTISLSPSDGIVLDDGRVIGIRPKPEMLAKLRIAILCV